MPKTEKQKPEEGQNDRWPGDGRREANEEIKTEKEITKIPEIRNDGKKYEGNSRS